MSDIKSLFQYYLEHQDELVKTYNGKYIVIVDNAVVGSYDRQDEAYFSAEAKFGLGNFLVQLCTPGRQDYTQHFTSRVSFS